VDIKSAQEFLRRNYKMASMVATALPTVGKALLGVGAAKLLGVGGGGGGGKSVQKVSPPDYAAQAYESGVSDLEALRATGGLGGYQTLSPYEKAQIERGMGLAAAPSAFYQPASEAAQQLLTGAQSFLSPAMSAYQRVLEQPSAVSQLQSGVSGLLAPAQEKIISQFARGGRTGSGAMGEALGRGATTALAPYLQKAQAADVQRQLDVARGLAGLGETGIRSLGVGIEAAPMVSTMPFTDIQRGLGLGGLLSQERFAAEQQPTEALREYSDILRNLTVGSTTTQPLYAPSSPSLGDIAGASIGKSLIESGLSGVKSFLEF
jgi:hypothetical protein